jgi:CubicO group peptidase (beta-lactamase class C family)
MTSRGRFVYVCLVVPFLAWGCSTSTDADNNRPSIYIASPAHGASFSRGDTVDIDVEASDDGVVVAVRFYLDGVYIGVDSTSPYQYRWSTIDAVVGLRQLRVVVEDDGGAFASQEIAVWLRWAYFPPEQVVDDWQTSTLHEEGFDTLAIHAMMNTAYGDNFNDFMHAVLVVRNGNLVLEEYFGDFRRHNLNHLQSTTKSFTSALIGIAIDRGYIGGVDDPFFDYLPRYAHLRDADKDSITLEHVLTMTPGLEWNEMFVPTLDASNDNMIGNRGDDYVAYALAKPVIRVPGTEWWYNSGCSMTLGEILRSATGLGADQFASLYLFGPLGIRTYDWPIMAGGHVSTHGGLYLRPRDMAKFGQLYLQDGMWNGERVISEEWVVASTRPFIGAWGNTQYGYQWWFENVGGYDVRHTSGYGGQYIFVVPELDMVIVTAAGYDQGDIGQQVWQILTMFRDRVLAAALPAGVLDYRSVN